ncbi:hypothetical protein [Bacillus pumilus]
MRRALSIIPISWNKFDARIRLLKQYNTILKKFKALVWKALNSYDEEETITLPNAPLMALS